MIRPVKYVVVGPEVSVIKLEIIDRLLLFADRIGGLLDSHGRVP